MTTKRGKLVEIRRSLDCFDGDPYGESVPTQMCYALQDVLHQTLDLISDMIGTDDAPL